MATLLIKDDQDLIFKPRGGGVIKKDDKEQQSNMFSSRSVLSEIDSNERLLSLVKRYFEYPSSSNYSVTKPDQLNLQMLTGGKFASVLNLKLINDIRYINKFLETVNAILPISGLYLGKVVTYPNRRAAIFKKYPLILNRFVYFFDYVFYRVFPKLPITKRLYFHITKGKGRVISRAEVYGRVYSCGFEIIDEKTINHSLFFVAKKVKNPSYDRNPSYAPLIGLERIGKSGKAIRVYKLRTMHPFAEYLQEYVYEKYELQEGGKIRNDFRISPEGRIFRKFWIDEIPMLINIFKGEMKLVGVRPLSKHFYSLYDKDLQQERIKNKPGFIPPYYADLPKSLVEIMASERKYLALYAESPLTTDVKYFFMALRNVIFKGARSK